jgi:hypothetical protein
MPSTYARRFVFTSAENQTQPTTFVKTREGQNCQQMVDDQASSIPFTQYHHSSLPPWLSRGEHPENQTPKMPSSSYRDRLVRMKRARHAPSRSETGYREGSRSLLIPDLGQRMAFVNGWDESLD